MSRDFPVKGLAELDRYLSALPKNMQKGAYRAGLVAAARPIRDEARLLAPKETGKMAKAIKTGAARQNPDGTFSITIRLDGEHSYLGLFQEYGVAAHLIKVAEDIKPTKTKKDGRVVPLSIGKINRMVDVGSLVIGENFVGPMVHHPGHAAHPFMRPALDAKADEAVKAFAGRIRDYIEGKTGFAAPPDEAA